MNIPRRLALPTLACLLSSAWAQDSSAWPAPGRQLKIITPTPVGVGSDIFARAYADQLGKVLAGCGNTQPPSPRPSGVMRYQRSTSTT